MTELISAIAKLWPIVLIAFLGVFIYRFESQLKGILERLLSIKWGNKEVIVGPTSEPTKPAVADAEKSALSQAVPSDPAPSTTPPDSPWNMQLVDASIARDVQKMDALFAELKDRERDPDRRASDEALYYWLKYDNGDATALDHLVQLAKRYPRLNRYLGYCYQSARAFEKAAAHFRLAVGAADNETDRTRNITSYAQALFRDGKITESTQTLTAELANTADAKNLASLYTTLATIYGDIGEEHLRAAALERALTLAPNDVRLRFSAAFSYSSQELERLALMHYTVCLAFNPKDSTARNNLGVCYDRLDLPGKAVNPNPKITQAAKR